MTRDKRVLWDADFYNSLPDEFCLYCLSKKQIYLIGQAITPQMRWATRWQGDISAIDIDMIASEVEGKLQMPECDNILNLLNDLQTQIISLQQTVENGGVAPENTTDNINTPYYQNTSTPLNQHLGNVTLPCATIAEKDALYGAVSSLVDYFVAQTTDFFEIFQQQVSRLPELVDGVVSAIPVFETLPLDEAISAVGYFADEGEEIWEAVDTVDRKQDFKCLLFCAALANNCNLTPDVIVSAIQTKMDYGTLDMQIAALRDAFAIMVNGSPIGDEFYYGMMFIQIQTVLLGERWVAAQGWRPYEMEYLAGKNSPDNDWSIFCDECPVFGYYRDFRFWTDDADQWDAIIGTYELEYFEGEQQPPAAWDSRSYLQIHHIAPEPFRVLGVGINTNANTDCGTTGETITFKLAGSPVGSTFSVSPNHNGTDVKHTYGVTSEANDFLADEIIFTLDVKRCDNVANSAIARCKGIRLWLASDSPTKGKLALQLPYNTGANGSSDSIWWRSWKEA